MTPTLVLSSEPEPRKVMLFGFAAPHREPSLLDRSHAPSTLRSGGEVDASCPDCHERYELRAVDLPASGRVVRCHRCEAVYRVVQPGALSGGVTVTRQTRCARCQTMWEVSDAGLANGDEVVCARCQHRFRPAVGDGLVASAPEPEGRITFGAPNPRPRPARPVGNDVMVDGHALPPGEPHITCPLCGTTYVATVPHGAPLQCTRCNHIFSLLTVDDARVSVRCASCHASWAAPARAVARDDEVSCPRCQSRFRPSSAETFTFGAPPAPVPQPPPHRPASEPGRSHVMLFGAPYGSTRVEPPAPPPPRGTDVWCPGCHLNNDLSEYAEDAPVVRCSRCGTVLRTTVRAGQTLVFADTATAAPVAFEPPVDPPTTGTQPPRELESPLRSRRGFMGVTAARAGRALQQRGRRLPLDVWLALADQLLTTLASHPLRWELWTGPWGFGIDLDGRFQAFAAERQEIALHRDWVHPTLSASDEPEARPARVWAVCRALVWLLDPFPTLVEGVNDRSARDFGHPQLTPQLHAVLDEGLATGEPESLERLRGRLLAAAPMKPAPMERVSAVLFAVGFDVPLRDELPPEWKDGALQVRLDALLEKAEPVERCPADPRAPDDAFSAPLTPTRTLELTMISGGQPIRRVSVTHALGFPERVSLPHRHFEPGQTVGLELRHPRQRARTVSLEAIVDAEGFARPVVDARTRADLDVLLASLSDELPAPVVTQPPPEHLEAHDAPVLEPAQLPPTSEKRGTEPLILFVTLPCALVIGLLVWTEAMSLATASKVGVALAVVVALASRALSSSTSD